MKKRRTKGLLRKSIFLILVVIFSNQWGFCDVVGISSINIDPPEPLAFSPFEITTSIGNCYVQDVSFVSSNSVVNGTSITLDYYFFDSNPFGIRLPIAGGWDFEEIFSLSQGDYFVTARAWVNVDEAYPMYELADSATDYFTVVPEPATVLLFLCGGLVMGKRR